MKKLNTIKKIFKENKNLRLSSKIYLCKTYLQNIQYLKSNIGNLYKTYSIRNIKDKNETTDSIYPLMEYELKELKLKIRKKRFDNIKNKFLYLFKLGVNSSAYSSFSSCIAQCAGYLYFGVQTCQG